MHGFLSAVLRLWRGGSTSATARQPEAGRHSRPHSRSRLSRSRTGSARRGRRLYEPDLALLQLEPRRLLNADFSVLADAVQLDLAAARDADTLTISRVGDDYQFSLNGGENWRGTDDANVQGAAMSVLSIDAAYAASLPGGIQILDDSDFGVVLDAAGFASLAGDLVSLSLVNVDSVESTGGAFKLQELTVTSFTETPFRLNPLDIEGDVSISSASPIEDASTPGAFRVAGDLSLTAGVLQGDLDGDNAITTADLASWRENYGAASGDVNLDGATDAIDYAIIREGLGRFTDAGSSSIDIGTSLDVEVTGATKLSSNAGGEIRVGVVGQDGDSGRTVELVTLSFQTTGDVSVIDDSADGVALATVDFDGDTLADANLADDVLIVSNGDVGLVGLQADDLTVRAVGAIRESSGAATVGAINLTGDAHLTAGIAAGPLAGDFDQNGVVNAADFAIWRAGYGATNLSGNGPGDANSDGVTDSMDYAIWRTNLGNLRAGSPDIELGSLFALTIAGDATLVSAAGGDINLSGATTVDLTGVKFETTGSVTIAETSASGFNLRRTGGQGSRATEATLTTTAGDLMLDSLDVDTLTVNSAGDITDASGAVIDVRNLASFTAVGDITLGEDSVANFGSLTLTGDSVTIEEASSTTLLEVTAAALAITSSDQIIDEPGFTITVAGPAEFSATNDITLENLAVTGAIRLTTTATGGDATIVNATAINLASSNIAGNLTVTATTGVITDSGAVTVGGMAQFTSLGGGADITLDTLAVTGPIGVTTTESAIDASDADATIVNATQIDFKETFVYGDFSVTARTGDILNNNAGLGGIVFTTGAADLTATGGGIFLGMAAAAQFGSLSAEAQSLIIAEADGMLIDRIVAQTADLSAATTLADNDGATIDITGDARFHADVSLVFADDAADMLEVGGLATFDVGTLARVLGDITIGPAGIANFGSLWIRGDEVTIQEDSSTTLVMITASEFTLTSGGAITDDSNIVIGGDATFTAAGPITLADNAGDVLTVTGIASFTAGGAIELGLGGTANFGTLALDTAGQFDADVREELATELGNFDVRDLELESGGGVTDITGAQINVTGDGTFDVTAAIVLANNTGDALTIGGAATFTTPGNVTLGAAGAANFGSLGVFAANATIREASPTRLDGVVTGAFNLTSAGSITDRTTTTIDVDSAVMSAQGDGAIVLANSAMDLLDVAGAAQLIAGGAVSLGVGGTANFGQLSVTGTEVEVNEASPTQLVAIDADSLDLNSGGDITNGRFSEIDISGNATFTTGDDINLSSGGGSRLNVGGMATFTAGGDLTIGSPGVTTFGSLSVSAANVTIQEDDATLLKGVSATSLTLSSVGAITDAPHTPIVVTDDASFTAGAEITLNDTPPDTTAGEPGDVLQVGGKASFMAGTDITIGPTGTFNASQIQFNAPGAVSIQEDSATQIAMDNTAGSLDLRSAGTITDATMTFIVVTADASFMAAGAITLNDMPANPPLQISDFLDVGGKASFSGTSITIGGGGQFQAGQVQFNSPGAVFIEEDLSAEEIVLMTPGAGMEVAMTNTAGTLQLESDGAITVSGTITVGGFAKFIAGGAINLNFDISATQVGLFAGDAITQTAGALTTPELLVMTTGDVTLNSTTNDVRRFAADIDEGSLDLFTTNALTIADLTINGMNVAGVAIADTAAASAHTLRLEAAGGDIDQQLQTVGDARIDVDVQTATFVVADSDSILLDDLGIVDGTGAPVVRDYATTNNRFFNDNGATQRESDLVFTSAGQVANLTVLDQTAVLLAGVDITGDLAVAAGRSPDAREPYQPLLPPDQPDTGRRAILDDGPVLVDGDVRLHAFAGVTGDLAIELDELAATGTDLAGLGNLVVTTNVGDARIVNDTALALRSDLATNVQGALTVEAQTGALTDAPAASITVAGDANFIAAGGITLNNATGDVLIVGGKASFAATNITVGSLGSFNARQIQFNSPGAVSIQEDSATGIAMGNTAGSLTLSSTGAITDALGTTIDVTGDAALTAGQTASSPPLAAGGFITLGNASGDQFSVGGDATLTAGGAINLVTQDNTSLIVTGKSSLTVDSNNVTGAITVGPLGTFRTGTLNFNARGAVAIQEDVAPAEIGTPAAGIDLVMSNTAGSLTLDSAESIRDAAGTSIVVSLGNANFIADTGIVLNDNSGDRLEIIGPTATTGRASFLVDSTNPTGSIIIGSAGTFLARTLNFNARGAVDIHEDNDTEITMSNTAGALVLDSELGITDSPGTSITVTGAATFTADTTILLSDASNDRFSVGELATFVVDPTNLAGAISVGFGNALGDGGRFFTGTLNFNARGEVLIQENSGAPGDAFTRLAMDNTAGTLRLESEGATVDEPHTSLIVDGDATLQAAGAITLADTAAASGSPSDVLDIGGLAEFIAGGDITISPAGAANFGRLSLVDLDTPLAPTITATVFEDSSTQLQEVAVGALTLRSDGDITDVAGAAIRVADTATFDTSSPLNNVVLGDGGALRLGVVRMFDVPISAEEADSSRQVANHVSLQVNESFLIGDTRVAGTYYATATAGGGRGSTGSIDQAATLDASDEPSAAILEADRLGLRATGGAVFIATAEVNHFAAQADRALDITMRDPRAVDASTRITKLTEQFAAARISEAEEAALASGEFRLAPTTITTSIDPVSGEEQATLTSLAVDNQFGVVLLSHLGNLTVSHVADATTDSPAGATDGVRSRSGHVFIETKATTPEVSSEEGEALGAVANGEAGDIIFSAANIADRQVVLVENDHVFTAVAAGELLIDAAGGASLVAEGTLGNGRGVVNDVSRYLSYDDRDGFDGLFQNNIAGTVQKEGVLLQVTPPSTDLDAPTTRLVGEGNRSSVDGSPQPNTQSVDLEFGRAGETNLIVHILWADRDLPTDLRQVTRLEAPATGVFTVASDAATVPFTHQFSTAFLNVENRTRNYGPQPIPLTPLDLPTNITVLSDPRINLFSEGGAQNLNRSVTPTDAPTPERIDNFVLATSQTLPPPPGSLDPPEATPLFVPPPIVLTPEPINTVFLQQSFEGRTTVATREQIVISYGPVDESLFEEALAAGKEIPIIEELEVDWKDADNYLAKIKQKILSDPSFPAGRYVIKAQSSDQTNQEVFVKPSTVADPFDGASIRLGDGMRGVAARLGLPSQSLMGNEPVRERTVETAAWTAAWVDWASTRRLPETDQAIPAVDQRADEPTAPTQDADPRSDSAMMLPFVDRSRTSSVDEASVGALMVGGVLLAREAKQSKAKHEAKPTGLQRFFRRPR